MDAKMYHQAARTAKTETGRELGLTAGSSWKCTCLRPSRHAKKETRKISTKRYAPVCVIGMITHTRP